MTTIHLYSGTEIGVDQTVDEVLAKVTAANNWGNFENSFCHFTSDGKKVVVKGCQVDSVLE